MATLQLAAFEVKARHVIRGCFNLPGQLQDSQVDLAMGAGDLRSRE